MAQIIYDALGKKWAVAFMSLIAVGQYLMAVSEMIALSRQIWSFARDDGLPVVYNFVKYVNPKIKVPIRASIFAGVLSTLVGLLVLIGDAGSGALFSLAIASLQLSWDFLCYLSFCHTVEGNSLVVHFILVPKQIRQLILLLSVGQCMQLCYLCSQTAEK